MDDMLKRFKAWGYPEQVLDQAKARSQFKTRELLLTKERPAQDRMTVVSKYSTMSRAYERIIKKHWSILKLEPDFNHIFNLEPIFVYSRGKNVGEIIKSPIKQSLQTVYKGTIPCWNCNNCHNVITGPQISHPMRETKSISG